MKHLGEILSVFLMQMGIKIKYVSKLTDAQCTSREDESSLLDYKFYKIVITGVLSAVKICVILQKSKCGRRRLPDNTNGGLS